MDFATMMKLEQHGIDTWVGAGPRYPWGGLYGGQIVAQALRAAAHTVEPRYLPHSLHAYFIRGGDHDQPVRFEVDRVRDGRSVVTRAVTARQSYGAIFNMSASFQVRQEGEDVQAATAPPLALPDGAAADGWTSVFERRMDPAPARGEATGWLRMADAVGDDPVDHASALAYMSDDLPMDAVVSMLPGDPDDTTFHDRWFSASLDHAMWFHRPFDAAGWHVEHFVCQGLLGSRGLALGHLFTVDGAHVATVSQEVLLRRRRREPE